MEICGLPKKFLVDKFPRVVVSALIMFIHFDLDHGVFSKHFGTQKFAFRPKILIFFLSLSMEGILN